MPLDGPKAVAKAPVKAPPAPKTSTPAPTAPTTTAPQPSNSQVQEGLQSFDNATKGPRGAAKDVNDIIGASNELSGNHVNNPLGRVSKVGGAGVGLLAAPGQVGTLMDGKASTQDKLKAGLQLGQTGLATTQTAGLVSDYRNVKGAAASAFREGAPNASKRMVSKAAGSVANNQVVKGGRSAGKRAMGEAIKKATGHSTLAKAMGTTSRGAGRAMSRTAGKGAIKAGAKVAGKGMLAAGGKIAGRFVPGVNVALAAMDGKEAYDAWNEKDKDWGKIGTKTLTALGSAAAATNIPIISQVGAGISAVGSLVSGLFGW